MEHGTHGSNGPDLRSSAALRDGRIGAAPLGRSQPSLTLTIPQAARLLGISTSAAYECARKGQIPTVKLGTRVLVSRKRLEDMIDGHNAGQAASA